jgi:hypothetical protein
MSSGFFSELKRRNVIRAAILYVGAMWALAQGIAQLSPVVGAPEWGARWFLAAGVIGFPFWIAFAWFYEFTPEGLKRESEIDPAESIAVPAQDRQSAGAARQDQVQGHAAAAMRAHLNRGFPHQLSNPDSAPIRVSKESPLRSHGEIIYFLNLDRRHLDKHCALCRDQFADALATEREHLLELRLGKGCLLA